MEDFCEVEFPARDRAGLDLTPSVYEVEHDQKVRAHVEHAAAIPLDPPRAHRWFDLHGLAEEVAATPGPNAFRFIYEAHRELRFESEAGLRAAASRLVEERVARCGSGERRELANYVARRLAAGDNEWRNLFEGLAPEKRRKWETWLTRCDAGAA